MKLSTIEAEAIENSPILEGEQARTFRSGTMRCAYMAQDRVDISEAIKLSCTSDVETESRTHGAIETSGEVLERSAKKNTAVLRARAKQSALGSARGQRLGWRRSNASEHVWRIVRRGRHLLRHSSTVQNVIGLSGAESEYYALTKGGCTRLGLQSLCADWNLEAATLMASGLFEREGSCFAKRSWQEHSSCADEDAMAAGTCGSTSTCEL